MKNLPFARRKRGGILRAAVFLLLFIAALGALGWMLLLPSAIESKVEGRTGFPVAVGSLSCNPFGLALDGKEVSVGNPKTFGGGDAMLDLRSLSIEASLPALARGEIWIESMEIDIKKATLALDERGELNLKSFLDLLFAGQDGEGRMPFRAVSSRVQVEEIEVVDYTRPVPVTKSFRPMLDVTLRDVDQPLALFEPILEIARRAGEIKIP